MKRWFPAALVGIVVMSVTTERGRSCDRAVFKELLSVYKSRTSERGPVHQTEGQTEESSLHINCRQNP